MRMAEAEAAVERLAAAPADAGLVEAALDWCSVCILIWLRAAGPRRTSQTEH
jgi:hypothetical protein